MLNGIRMSSNLCKTDLTQIILDIIRETAPESLKDLVSILHERLNLPEQELMTLIMKLDDEGKIQFSKELSIFPNTLIGYLSSRRAFWYWVTLIVGIMVNAIIFLDA